MLFASGAIVTSVLLPLSATSQVGGRPMSFSAVSMSGKRLFVSDLVENGPVFFYFIRYGDNVNNQFASHWNDMLRSYGTSASKCYGIIAADRSHADSWIAEYKPPYEMLMDPNMSLVQLYGVQSSPCVVEVGTDGKVIETWSGYSGYRLKGINAALAKASGVEEHHFDFSGTPSTTLYGSAFLTRPGG